MDKLDENPAFYAATQFPIEYYKEVEYFSTQKRVHAYVGSCHSKCISSFK